MRSRMPGSENLVMERRIHAPGMCRAVECRMYAPGMCPECARNVLGQWNADGKNE